ncbi:MAG TPA: bifunctional 5,10-methylenetetrahydrofolate dehydrogenase/5,10-methenyltetrahydrofolate cyclohydrolase [Candidatus Paceibacterota bacterium]
MEIIDGKKLREEILIQIKNEVSLLPFQPIFCDVLVGEDPGSAQYVRMKQKTAESVGMKFHNASFASSIQTPELITELKKLNIIPNMCGIIVQLPLPEHLDRRAILDAIDPRLDVDCLGTVASGKFYSGSTVGEIGFPTALACMALLDSINLDLQNKRIVVLGQGELVGKPVLALLKFRGLEPVPVTRKTENKEEILKNADVIISGIGHGKHITGKMLKDKVVLIDAGTSEDSKRLAGGRASIVGDVDLESVKGVASYVSPVPGGVGPVTVAMLLSNVLNVAKKLKQ